jgi:hypothetical protein
MRMLPLCGPQRCGQLRGLAPGASVRLDLFGPYLSGVLPVDESSSDQAHGGCKVSPPGSRRCLLWRPPCKKGNARAGIAPAVLDEPRRDVEARRQRGDVTDHIGLRVLGRQDMIYVLQDMAVEQAADIL